jgi:hypothetical protein
MKVVALSIALAIFIFLLLSLVLQNQITPPPPPPPQATFAAVSAEATRVAGHATEMAAERHVKATTEAIQTETSQIQTRTAEESARPLASATAKHLQPKYIDSNGVSRSMPQAGISALNRSSRPWLRSLNGGIRNSGIGSKTGCERARLVFAKDARKPDVAGATARRSPPPLARLDWQDALAHALTT